MAGGEAVIAVGIGCRRGVAADSIAALVKQALSQVAPGHDEVILFSHEMKREEAGLAEAAVHLSLPLRFVSQAAAQTADSGSVTRSAHSIETTGLASFSEAVALAGAGPGAVLLLARITTEGVACAIAKGT